MKITDVVTWLDAHAGVANWGLVLAAVVTAFIAVRQMQQARALRFNQARPYVAVGLRRIGTGVVELYVRNFGETVASDISIESDPPLESVSDPEWFRVFSSLPMLVPGEEWSTIWETQAHKRTADGFGNNRYEVTLRYKGRDGTRVRKLHDEYVIDWQPHLESTYRDTKTIHDVGKTLEKIEKSLQRIPPRQIALPPNPLPTVPDPVETPVVTFKAALQRLLRRSTSSST